MAMEVDVDRASGAIRVQRVAHVHDCGLIINPDALKGQIEGNIGRRVAHAVRGSRARPRERAQPRLGEFPDPALRRRA
jgi:CO/xanthine dehydrogenase Mo-binding subunit